jgi:hypothetical protein
MKYWLIFYLLSGGSTVVKAQTDEVWTVVDARSSYFPKTVIYSTGQIAQYIEQHFTGNKEKIRAAYRWVTANIAYDKDSMLPINWSKNSTDKIAATLRRKKGVCDNFASVYTDILLKMNIRSFVVHGFTKGSGSPFNGAHSWCAVHLGQQWYLCDPTWDAAYTGIARYFLISPAQFIETHYPFDPLWQLLPQPLSLKEFEHAFMNGEKNKMYFNVTDSVNIFLALDSLQQLEAAARRMKTAGLNQESLKTWYAYNQMNIAIIYGEQDMQLYNAAVADLNKANAFLNAFIEYRNQLFKPAKTDSATRNMLQPVSGLINDALKKTAAIGLAKENFQYDTALLYERIKAVKKRLEEQNNFLKNYFESNDREKFFYR